VRAYRVAYDGTGYHGFQRQPDVPTVEDRLLDALRALGVLEDGEDTPPGYAAAGRTDAGVSALAQTVAFEAPDWLTPRAFNAELPGEVRAWASAAAPAGFHATHDARRRRYRYHLHAPGADLDRARSACEALSGRQDFHNLTPDEDGTERRLTVELVVDEPFLVIEFAAGGFPRQLVRRAVGLVRAVAAGERDDLERVLSAEPLDGPEGVGAAPAEPLVLAGVDYPSLSFSRDPEAAASAHTAFERRRVERLTGARVAGSLVDGL
jgi:tRNA pseudouridine38-40 synthase